MNRSSIKFSFILITLSTVLLGSRLNALTIEGTPEEVASFVDTDRRDRVTIVGTHTERFPIEKADVTLIIRTKREKLADALFNNQRIENKVRSTLKESGIEDEAIVSENFGSTPEYGWFSDKAKSYEVTNKIKITVSNNGQFMEVAKLVDAIEELAYVNVQPAGEIEENKKNPVVTASFADLAEKKALYEEQLEIKLKLETFNVAVDSENLTTPIQENRKRESYGDVRLSSWSTSAGSNQRLSLVELSITAQVVAVYTIE